MSVASMVASMVRGERGERGECRPVAVVVVESKPMTGEEWTVEGWKQYMIGEGCDKEEIAEFVRKQGK